MSGRVALVTGGASGIGREICLELAAAGRRVAVADIQAVGADETAAAIRSAGGDAMAISFDITDTESASHSFKFKNAGTETLVIEKVGST